MPSVDAGECLCFEGYQGRKCGECVAGYLAVEGGTCVREVLGEAL